MCAGSGRKGYDEAGREGQGGITTIGWHKKAFQANAQRR